MIAGFNLNAILAALCLVWMAVVSFAILHIGSGKRPEPNLTLCPLCDQPVLISRDGRWNLHPDTP